MSKGRKSILIQFKKILFIVTLGEIMGWKLMYINRIKLHFTFLPGESNEEEEEDEDHEMRMCASTTLNLCVLG